MTVHARFLALYCILLAAIFCLAGCAGPQKHWGPDGREPVTTR